MAKIIKVGSQNPTFTSEKTTKASKATKPSKATKATKTVKSTKTKKANSIQTHRNSNEATNPFKFTNFEGKTLPFELAADVFETKKANKLRMVATSVTGSMNKIKSNITESIVNFVNRVRTNVSSAWDYAKNTNISDVIPGLKQVHDILNTPIHIPAIDAIGNHINGIKSNIGSSIGTISDRAIGIKNDISTKMSAIASNISFHGKNKYANMSVAELEIHLTEALADGGINE